MLAIVWRRPWFFVTLVAVTLAADGLSLLLRQWIGRGAFPSGHAATAFAAATVIAWDSRRLAIPAYALAALVAWSRVYVGVHWPLDVIGGAALGTLVAIALLKLLEAPRRSLRAPQAG